MRRLDEFLGAVAGRSAWLIPIILPLALLAGILTALTGPPPAPTPASPVAVAAGGGSTPSPTAAPEPTQTATADLVPTESPTVAPPTPTTGPPSPTPTPAAPEWRGRALSDAIIREQPTTQARPHSLLLSGETAVIDEVVTGEEVVPGNNIWFRVHAGLIAGYVYSTLFEPDPQPTPGGGQ